ncbi:MAG: mechanosensitive ion channel [Chloroflexales bacterium]|nr:mechanosensitive ion channel [Chloroflexales bacterium]
MPNVSPLALLTPVAAGIGAAALLLLIFRLLRGTPHLRALGPVYKVLAMIWRATRFVTVDNTRIVVPNANLAQAEISNYSLASPLQALHVQIAISPEHPPGLVKGVLARAAAEAEGVLADPAPGVRLIAYSEYSVNYDIKFWMRGFERYVETRDAVLTSAWYHARRAGLRLAAPRASCSSTRATASWQPTRPPQAATAGPRPRASSPASGACLG